MYAYKERDFVSYSTLLSKDLWADVEHDTVKQFFGGNYKNLYALYST
jgi:hypothetical protein